MYFLTPLLRTVLSCRSLTILSLGDNSPNIWRQLLCSLGFPGGLVGKESACNAGDTGFIPRSERCPGEGNGTPLQYSCPENSMDRGAWQATVHGVVKSQTRLNGWHTQIVLPQPSSVDEAVLTSASFLNAAWFFASLPFGNVFVLFQLGYVPLKWVSQIW